MNYSLIPPPRQLQHLVKCFWTIETVPGEFKPDKYYLMADACPEILFQYKGGFKLYAKEKAHVRVQHTVSKNLALENEFGFFGVRLFPHAIQQLLGMPATEATELILEFNYLFKQAGRDLTDKLLESTGAVDRAGLFSEFLLRLAANKRPDPIYSLANELDLYEGQIDLTHLRLQSGLSLKQFERRFKATTGFTPKQFARVARFQSTKRRYVSKKYQSLTKLTYDCNYHDQSHFIREFKEFSGVQASHYFSYLDKGDAESKVIRELILAKERPVFLHPR